MKCTVLRLNKSILTFTFYVGSKYLQSWYNDPLTQQSVFFFFFLMLFISDFGWSYFSYYSFFTHHKQHIIIFLYMSILKSALTI